MSGLFPGHYLQFCHERQHPALWPYIPVGGLACRAMCLGEAYPL